MVLIVFCKPIFKWLRLSQILGIWWSERSPSTGDARQYALLNGSEQPVNYQSDYRKGCSENALKIKNTRSAFPDMIESLPS